MSSDRERFCAVLWSMPVRQADAIVLLTGDGVARIDPAVQLFGGGAAPKIIVSGGVHRPPYALTASTVRAKIIEAGVHPDAVLCEEASANTYEQAVNVLDMCEREDWRRLLLVASGYHAPRALLTFLKVKGERTFHMSAVPMSWRTPWWGVPAGLSCTRLDLLDEEFQKIARYQDFGHVAGYDEGLEYLRGWYDAAGEG